MVATANLLWLVYICFLYCSCSSIPFLLCPQPFLTGACICHCFCWHLMTFFYHVRHYFSNVHLCLLNCFVSGRSLVTKESVGQRRPLPLLVRIGFPAVFSLLLFHRRLCCRQEAVVRRGEGCRVGDFVFLSRITFFKVVSFIFRGIVM